MCRFLCFVFVFSQGEIAFTVLFGVYLESIVEKAEKMSFQSVNLQGGVRFYHF